jgi:TolA-binding protein
MRSRTLRILLLCWMTTLQAGCFWFTPKEEGEMLRKEVDYLSDRVQQMENEQAEKQAHLTEMISRAHAEVVKLEETLNKATRILSRNSADFGADMETVKEKLRSIDGVLAEIRHEVELTGKQAELTDKKVHDFALAAGLDLPVDGSSVPKDPEQHLNMIRSAFDGERYGECRALGSLFLERHPSYKSADVAQLYIARSYLAQKRWAKALGALRTFTDKYPRSVNTPEALYEMARSFYSLGDCTDARILLDALMTRHKNSEYADKAKKLRELMKQNKAHCTS